jgi:Protein of unknown function (DUF2637)
MNASGDHPPATRSRRFLAALTLAALSAITGIVSYEHGLEVVRLAGNTGLVAFLVPLVPDLMIVTSSLTLLEASAVKAPRPGMAMVALVAGIGWTVAMNVAAGWRHGTGGALIAAGVPLAFVVTFESLLWLYRRGRGGVFPEPAPATHGHVPPLTLDAVIEAAAPHLSKRQIAAAFEVSRARVDKVLPPAPNVAGTADPPAVPATLNGSASG